MSARKSPPAEEISYAAAVEELEAILGSIEDDSISIDLLAPRVERAAWLVQRCRQLLAGTEARVAAALQALDPAAGADEE